MDRDLPSTTSVMAASHRRADPATAVQIVAPMFDMDAMVARHLA